MRAFFRFSLFSFLLCCCFPAVAQEHADRLFILRESEHILRFHSDIKIQRNRSIIITEQVRVIAKGSAIQRGIYRDIPLEYTYKGSTMSVGFKLLSVKRDGKDEPFHVENHHNGVRIYCGAETVFLQPDVYNYELTYVMEDVLGMFPKHDELYWNINGNGWAFLIDSTSAAIHLPGKAKVKEYTGFTGGFGDDGREFETQAIPDGIRYTVTRKLIPGENLTVVVGWDKNHIAYPTTMEKWLKWLRLYGLWVLAIVSVIATFLFNFIAWWRFGRDPKPGTIMPQYRAPEGLSPAECAYIHNHGKTTGTLFSATLISLATQKQLKIDVKETGTLFKSKEFTLDKTGNGALPNAIETSFFDYFFKGSDSVTIIRKKHNPHLAKCQDNLYKWVEAEHSTRYFIRNSRLKIKQYLIPFLALTTGIVVFSLFGGALAAIFAGLIASLVINIIFTRLYEQPTKEGRQLIDHIEGFILYMNYADKERLRLMNPPDMNFSHFEENLPYAIALGVAENWAEQFDPGELEQLYTNSHSWYTGVAFASMHALTFSDLSSSIASASVPPGSSSGFSGGGGGFSGGGGGGGGGGGW